MGPLVQRDLGQMPLLPIRDKAALRIDSVEIKIVQHLSFIGEVAFRLSFYFIFPFITVYLPLYISIFINIEYVQT